MKIVFGAVLVFTTGGVWSSFAAHWQSFEYLKKACSKSDSLTVEGKVDKFDPMPVEGHRNESFSVAGKRVSYSNFDLTNPGFKNATSHGGPIQPGLLVRIRYAPSPEGEPSENWIGKLEIADPKK